MAATLCSALITQNDPQLQAIGQKLGENLPDQVWLQLITALLANYPVLLVLDNFEDNLKLGGKEYLDAITGPVMQTLHRAAQRGKLLVTCRYPVPEADDWLATEAPGPLSPAQTGKLMLRLGALSRQDPESLRLVQRTIGGHPRMLEYLDAILRKGKGARVADVARRLREQAQAQNIDLRKERSLEEAMQVALQVGAGDILLGQLLELAAEREGDLQALQQAAVFPMPVSLEGLAFCLADGKPGSGGSGVGGVGALNAAFVADASWGREGVGASLDGGGVATENSARQTPSMLPLGGRVLDLASTEHGGESGGRAVVPGGTRVRPGGGGGRGARRLLKEIRAGRRSGHRCGRGGGGAPGGA